MIPGRGVGWTGMAVPVARQPARTGAGGLG